MEDENGERRRTWRGPGMQVRSFVRWRGWTLDTAVWGHIDQLSQQPEDSYVSRAAVPRHLLGRISCPRLELCAYTGSGHWPVMAGYVE
jgi:hypothetical protein